MKGNGNNSLKICQTFTVSHFYTVCQYCFVSKVNYESYDPCTVILNGMRNINTITSIYLIRM